MDNKKIEKTEQEIDIKDCEVVMVQSIETPKYDNLPKVDIYDKKRNRIMLQKFIDAGKKGGEDKND